MIREQTIQTLKLQLLACVLALALLWHSLNPAPRSMSYQERKEKPPDKKKRDAVPRKMLATLPDLFRPAVEDEKSLLLSEDDDAFEWPEYIDG